MRNSRTRPNVFWREGSATDLPTSSTARLADGASSSCSPKTMRSFHFTPFSCPEDRTNFVQLLTVAAPGALSET